jgi:oxygen-independent coproporphyrinogen-3 oxidase
LIPIVPVGAGAPAVSAVRDLSGARLEALPPLSLYVHIPWCVRKCPYCDFNSHEAKQAIPEEAYVNALIADLEAALPQVWGRRVYSIFFGGGTPSLFSAKSIEALLEAFRARLPLAPDCEVTLEANPGTFESDKFRDYRSAGVNRLSIGIQSFNPRHLKALGRIHDDAEAHRAVEIAHRHFDNFNLDLMYALPQQTPEECMSDVGMAIACGTQHLSLYHLTLEPNTPFHRTPPTLPDDDAAAMMQEAIESALGVSGYQHYETSAYARHGRESRHNLNYWRFGDYLGIGAGAHSKLSFSDRIVRQMRWKHPRNYLEQAARGVFVQEENPVGRADRVFEFMMNALRLTDGFAGEDFVARTGLPLSAAERGLREAPPLSWPVARAPRKPCPRLIPTPLPPDPASRIRRHAPFGSGVRARTT